MSKPHIERSNERGKFTDAEIRQHLAESKKFWNSPAGQAEQRRIDQRKNALPKTKFPSLAARGTKPVAVDPLAARRRMLDKI